MTTAGFIPMSWNGKKSVIGTPQYLPPKQTSPRIREAAAMIRSTLLAAAAVLGLAGPALADTEIVFYHYQTGASREVLKSIIADFEGATPGVKVREIFKSSETITADVQSALAARRPVDIATVIGKNINFFLTNTPAVALNEDPAKAPWLDNYLPNFLDLGRVGGKVYAIPHAYGTPMLYVNKTLFAEAGLDPNKLPRTWDEVIAAAQAVTARTKAAGVAQLQASSKDYGTMLMVTAAGAEYLSKDGTRALFDSPKGIAALQMWQDLAVKYKVMPIADDRQWTAAFQGGRMAMYINSSAGLRGFVDGSAGKFELGVAQYPLFGNEPRRVPNSGAALMLYAPAGEKRDAALKFLGHLSKREVSNRWSRETGYMPLAKDPLADPAMKRYVEEFPRVAPVIAQMAETVPTAVWPEKGTLEAQNIVSNLIDDLWAGKASAAVLVPDAVKRMNQALAANKQ